MLSEYFIKATFIDLEVSELMTFVLATIIKARFRCLKETED